MSRVRGVCDDVTCPFLHSGVVQVLKAGQVHTNDPFCCPNSPLQSSREGYLFVRAGAQKRSVTAREYRVEMSWA